MTNGDFAPIPDDARSFAEIDHTFSAQTGLPRGIMLEALVRAFWRGDFEHNATSAVFYPEESHLRSSLTPLQPPPDITAQLRYEVIVDSRFTSSNAVHSETVDNNCEPPRLTVTADL